MMLTKKVVDKIGEKENLSTPLKAFLSGMREGAIDGIFINGIIYTGVCIYIIIKESMNQRG